MQMIVGHDEHDIERGRERRLRDSMCLKCLMCLDSCITCGFRMKEYLCCFCLLSFLIVIIVLSIFLKNCFDAGAHQCMVSIIGAIKGNSTRSSQN